MLHHVVADSDVRGSYALAKVAGYDGGDGGGGDVAEPRVADEHVKAADENAAAELIVDVDVRDVDARRRVVHVHSVDAWL